VLTDSTVIIPAFNEGSNIIRQIKGIAQLYGDQVELFVVVDFNNDSTIEHFNKIQNIP